MNDDRTLLPEQSRQAFERAYAAIPAITPTKETAWQIWNAALSAAPAQEPVGEPLTLDQRYWLDRRGDIIAALEAEGLQIWSDKDRVWLHRLSASPLPQEPQEVKALTDERINELAAEYGDKLDQAFIFNRLGRFSAVAFARAIERELRGAQEGKAGEPGRQELLAVAQMVIEEYAGGGDWQSVERAARAAMSATLASREGEQR